MEAGGDVVAHERRLQATVLLFQAAERDPSSSPILVFSFSVSFTSDCPFVLSVLF